MPDTRTSGMLLVTLASADTATPGNRFYRVDLQIGSVWVVAAVGRLHVQNT